MSAFHHSGPQQIERVASSLGDLLPDVVFAGGSILPLLMTDPTGIRFRETDDVDFVVEIVSRVAYGRFEEALRLRGFRHVMEPRSPICRFRVDGILVDAMPMSPDVLGFANQWYPYGIESAREKETPGGFTVRHLSPPAFLATKLEAFRDRGRNDYLASHDLEDVLTVLDGCADIVGDTQKEEPLHTYLAEEARALLNNEAFLDALPGHIAQGPVTAARATIVLERLREIAALA